jgi:hypothetical protein
MFARVLALITPDRFGRLQRQEPVGTRPQQNIRLTVAADTPTSVPETLRGYPATRCRSTRCHWENACGSLRAMKKRSSFPTSGKRPNRACDADRPNQPTSTTFIPLQPFALRRVKLRCRVRVVEDRGDDVVGMDAVEMRGGNKRPPRRPVDIDFERRRVAARVLLELYEI